MTMALIKGAGIWLLIMLAAIANGVLREALLEPALGPDPALPLSGGLLALIIFAISWLCVPFIGRNGTATWLAVGLLWVTLTLVFEYLFGHFVAGIPWREIGRVFDVHSGNLFSMDLLVAFLSPWLAAHLRGQVN